jgi:hypothetical protein
MSDDDTELTDDDRAAAISWYHALIEDRAHPGKLHYSMPNVRGMAPPGAFRIPHDVIDKLGGNSPHAGGAVAHAMFGIEDDPDDPTLIHPHVVRIIGNGDIRTGRRVLEKFIQRVRHGAQPGDGYLQPDGTRPARVIR